MQSVQPGQCCPPATPPSSAPTGLLPLDDCVHSHTHKHTPQRNDVGVCTSGTTVFSPCYHINREALTVFGSTDTTPDPSSIFRRVIQPAATTRHTLTRTLTEGSINNIYRACCCLCRAASLLSLRLSAARRTFTLPVWLRMRTGRRSVSCGVRRRIVCDII